MPKNTGKSIVRTSPTQIETDRGLEDVLTLRDRGVKTVRVKIHGNQFHMVNVADIPVSGYHLDCGCTGEGIAVQVGNGFFCNQHNDHQTVVSVGE